MNLVEDQRWYSSLHFTHSLPSSSMSRLVGIDRHRLFFGSSENLNLSSRYRFFCCSRCSRPAVIRFAAYSSFGSPFLKGRRFILGARSSQPALAPQAKQRKDPAKVVERERLPLGVLSL